MTLAVALFNMYLLDMTMIKIETFDEYKKLVLLGEKRNVFSHQLFRVDCDKDLVIIN
jgi:hypothetical protein